METVAYKVVAIKGDNAVGIGIEKLDENMQVIAFISMYVAEPISYREAYRRAIKYLAITEGKKKRLLISIPYNICGTDTFKMLRRQAPLHEITFRSLPRGLNLTCSVIAHDAIERKTTIKEVL